MYQQEKLVKMLQWELERESGVLRSAEQEMRFMPEGHLTRSESNGHCYYYRGLVQDRKNIKLRIYEETADGRALLAELRRKRVLRKAIPLLRRNVSAIEKLLCQFTIISDPQMVMPRGSVDGEAWKESSYEQNPFLREGRRVMTLSGEYVRSKSEAAIYDALWEAEVPFRYEAALSLSPDRTIYPDFTLLEERNRRILLWEHFGLLSDAEYARKALGRLISLAEAGYHLEENLFITWETSDYPFSNREAKRMVERILSSAKI